MCFSCVLATTICIQENPFLNVLFCFPEHTLTSLGGHMYGLVLGMSTTSTLSWSQFFKTEINKKFQVFCIDNNASVLLIVL